MIDLYRLPSTKRWLTECLERYGIQLREPVILWLSVQRTNCSESRPRNSGRWTRNRHETQRDRLFDIEDPDDAGEQSETWLSRLRCTLTGPAQIHGVGGGPRSCVLRMMNVSTMSL